MAASDWESQKEFNWRGAMRVMNDLVVDIIANPKDKKRLIKLLLDDTKKSATIQIDKTKKYKITRKESLEIPRL